MTLKQVRKLARSDPNWQSRHMSVKINAGMKPESKYQREWRKTWDADKIAPRNT
jgi:hypothetical protein